MDFSTTIYDSTVHDNYYATTDSGSLISATQLNAFMHQLLSTVDLATLGSVYFHQLNQHLNIANISLSDYDSRLVYGKLTGSQGVQVELALPMCQREADGLTKYVYYAFDKEPGPQVRARLAQFHQLFSQQLVHALEFRRLKQIATKDTLTGLGNRNGFNDSFSRLICRAHRHEQSFGLLVIDLDNFKKINDTRGHREGDSVLVNVATQIAQSLRGEDEAFRFGGDEFCCLLDCQTTAQLEAAACRLQRQIRSSAFLRRYEVTVSLGGAIFREDDDVNALFDRADSALYKAKESGKNTYQAA